MRQPPVIVAEHLRKRFYATQALDDVSLTLHRGEVHAIVGENGAGKSTLIKILGGIHQPDSGRVLVSGVERGFRNPREAMATGIVLIPQELRLVPAFTVAENVMLGHAPMRLALGLLPVVDRRRMRDGARPALERLGFTPDLDRRVNELPYSEQQLVAIAKALSREATVLILDEPTAALERREDGQLLSGSFMEYALPRADHLPMFVSEVDESQPCTHNPLGAKGCGESGAIGAPAAVVSAILDALLPLGVTDIGMPVTPHRIWQAINDAERSPARR